MVSLPSCSRRRHGDDVPAPDGRPGGASVSTTADPGVLAGGRLTRPHSPTERLTAASADPADPAGPAGVRIAVRVVTASGDLAGGDWCEAQALPGGAVGLAVGDVMGHDAAAARAMVVLRRRLRALALAGRSPSAVLDELDLLVQHLPAAPLTSALFGRLVLDGGGGMLRYANAGHLPPLLRTPDGRVRLLGGGRSVILGAPLVPPRRSTEACVLVPAGSTLVLCTDGLVERRGQSLDDGLRLLQHQVERCACSAAPEQLCSDLLEELVHGAPEDDVAVLAARLPG